MMPPVTIEESSDPLVDLSSFPFVLEPMYFKDGLSGDSRMFLRKTVAEKLLKIQKGLQRYTFKIWDGFRPRSVQQALYEKFWNELKAQHPDWDDATVSGEVQKFVADPNNPAETPPHTTGGTIDLTLVDMSGTELDMGTAFDHFGPEASPYYFEARADNDIARTNRKLLRDAMFAEDFSINENEWWHFDYGNQKWAMALGKPRAPFGETETPKI